MTVAELKKRLADYPDDMYVFIAERKTEFSYGLLNSVSSKEIAFSESQESEVLATDTVVILDEE